MALAYVDWVSQEFGIGGALSGDEAMKAAYLAGDVYLAFGKQCGRMPPDATKKTHGTEREMLKQCVLGIGYGMGQRTLATKIGQPEIVARDLLRIHRATYPKFWSWSDAAVDSAMMGRTLWTAFRWPIRIGDEPNPRGLQNFPCRATAPKCCASPAAWQPNEGYRLDRPSTTDPSYAPIKQIDREVAALREAMAEASKIVLAGSS